MRRLLLVVVAALVCLLAAGPVRTVAYAPPAVVKIGATLPLSGPLSGAGHRAWMLMNLSLGEVATRLPGMLPNTTLELIVADTQSTQAGMVRATLKLASEGVAGLIGAAEGLNLLSNAPDFVPTAGAGVGVGSGGADASVLTWMANSLPEPLNVLGLSSTACMSRSFSDRTLFPYLCRMCVKMTAKARAMLAAFKAFGWKKMAIFAQDTNDGYGDNSASRLDPVGSTLAPGQSEADYLLYELGQLTSMEYANQNVLRLRLPSITSLAVAEIPLLLQQLKDSGYRIIVLYLQGDLLKSTMRQAANMGMLQSPYVWIGAGGFSGPSSAMGMGSGSVVSGGMGTGLCSQAMISELADLTPAVPSVDSSVGEVISTFKSSNIGADSSSAPYIYQTTLSFTSNPLLGVMCFVPAVPRTPDFTNLRYKLADDGLTFDSILDNGDAAAFDSVLVYAAAVDALIKNQAPLSPTGIWSGSDMFNAVKNVSLPTQAIMQNLQFDSFGDGFDDVDIYNYDPYGSFTGAFVRRGWWSQSNGGELNLPDALIWSDGTTDLPPDHVDPFDQDQVMTHTIDSGLVALVYFFCLLPSLLFFYNARILAKSFIEGEADDRTWVMDGARALVFLALSGLFASVYLSFLSINFETGTFSFDGQKFAGTLVLAFFGLTVIVFAPFGLETWWQLRKGDEAKAALREDFDLHLEDGEEVASPAAQAKTNKEQDKDAKDAKALASEKRAAARAARAKARKGGLIRDDSDSWLEVELVGIWHKTTPGLAASSALFATLVTGLFYQGADSLLVPFKTETAVGSAFGVWLVEFLLLHGLLVRAFKDSRDVHRVLGSFILAATLLMAFHANLSCLTFKYTGTTATASSVVDQGGVAIAHAILFAVPFFVGLLQLIKALKLSRHSLDSVLNGMKAKLAQLEANLDTAKAERKTAAQDADHLKRLLELSNLCRPLHRNHALAFTMAETNSGAALDSTATSAGSQQQAKQFVPASFVQEAAKKSQGVSGQSQGIQAQSNITGLDFGFLARPKAEMTGYKLLNELSLELFLASGPVHHRAVADIHLSHILSHPLTLELFKDTLTRPGLQEALAFWLDIQRFKQLNEDALRRQIAEAMVATFLYSDAPHPINCLTPASREQMLNVIFAKKGIKSSSFHFIEQELVNALKKEYASFVTTTGFKVCAFLLGHSSYRPSTRIKTLNPGGAVVGDGGKLVPITQNQAPTSAAVDQSVAVSSQHDDPHSSVNSGFAAAKSSLAVDAPIVKPNRSPGAQQRGKFLGAGGSGVRGVSPSPGAGGPSPPNVVRMVTTDLRSPSNAASSGLSPNAVDHPILMRNPSDVASSPVDEYPNSSDEADEDADDEEKKPLSPAQPPRKIQEE